MDFFMKSRDNCASSGMGMLPACAPLANPYVPFQNRNPEVYSAAKGMVRGTMFPGLDLPFKGMINEKEKSNTALHQLQSLAFAVSELGLYLDTHSDDEDAVNLFNQYVEKYADALQMYERKHGSLTQMDSAVTGTYDWLKDPWPWDYEHNKEG